MAFLKKSTPPPLLCLLEQRNLFDSLPETLLRKSCKAKLFFIFLSLLFFTFFFSFLVSRNVTSATELAFFPKNIYAPSNISNFSNHVLREEVNQVTRHTLHVPPLQDSVIYESVSVLLPDWEVLAIVSPETQLLMSDSVDGFYCLFSSKETSEARFSGVLPLANLTTFKCVMPKEVRRQRPFFQPVLTRNPEKELSLTRESPAKELIRTSFYVYESLSTENDVALFAKGVNTRQGFNRPSHELRCVFGDDKDFNTLIRTPVTSSIQEVFRCAHPDLAAFSSDDVQNNKPIKVSIEITNENRILPSVAYYTPKHMIAKNREPKSLICASTMVYNVGKFLKEWVMYHSRIGVEKFILYDNDSDDNLESVAKELNEEGYNVTTILWHWPKTQEAGFSHNSLYSKDSCTWMMYLDVDEFVYSPSWDDALQPSNHMLKSLLPRKPTTGQVSFRCNDFGPSGQTSHPVEGVTQGYNCHRKVDQQRHKSIVLLDAVDDSLYNVIHHFGLKKRFKWKQMSEKVGVVNHYKYQAWSEFKNKYRRRVSAYVVDWKQAVNPKSQDRTPGLGFEPIEPKGWRQMFCDVRDDRLKLLNQRWFGNKTGNGFKMAWQR